MFPLLIRSALRLLFRNKTLSVIKITGLAIGCAIFLLTTLFTLEELRYDKQHPGYQRIYRYIHRVSSSDGIQDFSFTSATTGPALIERFPQVETFTRIFFPVLSVRKPNSDILFNERKFGFADRNFFEVFNFPLQGPLDPERVLEDPMTVVLTPSSAEKYFGAEDPIGKTLIMNGELSFTVTGITQKNPYGSHLDFDFIASFSSLEVIRNHPVVSQQIPASLNLETKGFAAFYTYLVLKSSSAASELEEAFPAFIEEFRGKGRSERLKPYLQSLESIHLYSDLLYEIKQNGSAKATGVYFFTGLLIIFIACINYINTSTAEFMNRARGIGLKKILGINRSSLIMAHLTETVVLAAFSIFSGFLMAWLIVPYFNGLVNRHVQVSLTALAISASVFILIIIASGIYPAITIARLKAMEAFRGNIRVRYGSFGLRNVLVVFQLVASFSLLTMALLIYHQLDFLLKKDLGFDAHQVLSVNANSLEPNTRIALKSRFEAVKQVSFVSMCSVPPGESLFTYGVTLPENTGDEERRIGVYQSFVDNDYYRVLGLSLIEGRFFDGTNPADSGGYVVINSAASRAIGERVLNRDLIVPSMLSKNQTKKNIAGIVSDFNFASLHSAVEPLVLEYNPHMCRYFLIRIESDNALAAIEGLGKVWKEAAPFVPFDYTFLDDSFARFYEDEQRQKKVIMAISFIAITLAALGIFGTTLFLAQRKTKEVGIRKMLGSDRFRLMLLLFRPTFLLLLLSCGAGIPIARIVGLQWLEQYPYRIEFSPILFVLAFVIVLAVVILTVLYHTLKVTKINPTEVLREVQ